MKEYFDEEELSEEELRKKLRKQREMRNRRRMIRKRKRLAAYSILLGIFCVFVFIVTTIIRMIFSDGSNAVAGSDGDFNLAVKTPAPTSLPTDAPTPVQTKGLIVIDPGHGGMDGGTTGIDIHEKELVLQISLKLRDELEKNGYEVYMTRAEDVYIGLSERPKLANELDNPLMFISLHMNAVEKGADTSPNGTEIICYERDGSKELAELLLDYIVEATGSRKRSVLFSSGMVVTREANMPACLIESGFISNPEECTKLKDSAYQDKLIQGIINGIEAFLEAYPEWSQKE